MGKTNIYLLINIVKVRQGIPLSLCDRQCVLTFIVFTT